jgi:hypothetical protein
LTTISYLFFLCRASGRSASLASVVFDLMMGGRQHGLLTAGGELVFELISHGKACWPGRGGLLFLLSGIRLNSTASWARARTYEPHSTIILGHLDMSVPCRNCVSIYIFASLRCDGVILRYPHTFQHRTVFTGSSLEALAASSARWESSDHPHLSLISVISSTCTLASMACRGEDPLLH